MAVRQIRRVFATPFIVTTAIVGSACGPKPLPKHDHVNPPGPHANPPAPEPVPPPTEAASPGREVTPTDPPSPQLPPATPAPVEPAKESAKEPAKFEQRWTVMKFKDQCSAMVDVRCPQPVPGKVAPTCNPPPPIKYACPDGFNVGDTLKILLRVGATDCFVDRGPITCPPNAKCNPPPPRKVACPER